MRGSVVFYLLFLVLYKLLIKLRIEVVKILFIQLGLYLFQRLPETLEMHDFPGPEEFKGFSYLRVFNDADQVVIRGPGLLFCRQVLMKVCDGIAFGLEFAGIKGNTCSSRRPKSRGVVDIIGVKAAVLACSGVRFLVS